MGNALNLSAEGRGFKHFLQPLQPLQPPQLLSTSFNPYSQHFLNNAPVIAQPGHLVLTAQLVFLFQPFVEMPMGKGFDKGRPECNVLVSFGFVVAVQFFQFLIQDGGEKIEVVWFLFKLYQPFVGTVSFFTKINRACRIISDNSLGDFAGFGDGPLCIIDDQFLAKCIDEKLQSANDFGQLSNLAYRNSVIVRAQALELEGLKQDLPAKEAEITRLQKELAAYQKAAGSSMPNGSNSTSNRSSRPTNADEEFEELMAAIQTL